MPPPDGLVGGGRLQGYLRRIAEGMGREPTVAVGFLEGSTEADGTSIPMIAAINEFGGVINVPAGQTTIYRQTNAAGTGFIKNGRFVTKAKSNFATTHATSAHTITIPPRPFFRNMIAAKSGTWGDDIAKILPQTQYDSTRTLALMGDRIKGQLQTSIVQTNDPPNAPSTIRKKRAAKPLVDTGAMLASVDYEVSDNI